MIDGDIKRNNLAGNLNWKHIFDTAEHNINFDIDFSTFKLKNGSSITNQLQNGSSYNSTQLIDNPVAFGVFKTDYTRPFGSNSKIEAGLKTSFATIDNYLSFRNGGFVDSKRSTDFNYYENINAAYVSVHQKWNNGWEIIAGLRTEQTVAKGKSQDTTVFNRNYWQLFPSLFITRKIDKNFSTVWQYTRRVNRPSYQQQNPFIEYLDSLTYTRGNPLLRPEISNQFKIGLNYQNQPFFSVSYNKTSDVIFENAPRQEGNLTYTTSENLAAFENIVFELNFPINIGKKITGYGGNQFIWNHYKAAYLGSVYDRHKWNWQAYWQVSYKPKPDWNFEVSGFYNTPFLNEFIVLNEMGSLNLAIQKSFMEKKARLTLTVSDFFLSQQSNGSIQYQNIDLTIRQLSETRNIRLAFIYSFGNQKLQSTRARSTGSDAETNRVKTN